MLCYAAVRLYRQDVHPRAPAGDKGRRIAHQRSAAAVYRGLASRRLSVRRTVHAVYVYARTSRAAELEIDIGTLTLVGQLSTK